MDPSNFAEEFADGIKIELFYNILFNDNNDAGLVESTDIRQRINNWTKLNTDLFERDLKNRVYLDKVSIRELATGKVDTSIMKLLGVLLGFVQGTADGYATMGEENDLMNIDGALVISQPVSWSVFTEVVTASDTSDEERKTGFSREKVFQGAARRRLVEKRYV